MNEATEGAKIFDPSQHLVKLRQGQYLEVKWRLVWLRTVHPDAHIETEMIHFDPENKMAVFRARITLPSGGSATGYGSETSDDFKDFIEKAETKSIGRACAAMGFGTQHCQDFDYGAGKDEKVVDSPVQQRDNYARQTFNAPPPANPPITPGKATAKQISAIWATAKNAGLDKDGITAKCKAKFGIDNPRELSIKQASEFIDSLKASA